ncbi:MAG: DUF5686 and carboxypeptidase regulatory-like domain-containing protein [Ignavibacteria bacterium]|nr:DUF5686 and carboxypeptidase regulatory-like domain-containing protein [Ignavibacteria bacterium]
MKRLRNICFYFTQILFVTLLISSSIPKLIAHNVVGWVFDQETKKPIAGVWVQLLNSNKGTYSSPSGFFKLPNVPIGSKLLLKSLGYEQQIQEISSNDTLFVYLIPSPIKMQEVEKVGEIYVEEIIRRAIKKKRENLANLKTLQAKIYSKLFLELENIGVETSFDTSNKRRIINFKTKSAKDSLRQKYSLDFAKNFILETFSDFFVDYQSNIKYSEITQRRQTANIPKEVNQLVFSEFLSFYEETVKIVSTEFITPLADNALEYYKYSLLGKEAYGDLYVYNIKVEPNTRIYPTFTGTIKILEKSYNLLEINLKPSEFSSVDFFDSLNYSQKFTTLGNFFWQPTFLEISGRLSVNIVKGFLDFKLKFKITSIVSDAIINQPLPDSIVAKARQREIYVSPVADSTKDEFWENNSLFETTDKEKEIYRKVDTAAKVINADSLYLSLLGKPKKKFNFGFSVPDDFGYNRVLSYNIGISPYLEYDRYKFTISPTYSFGQKEMYYDAKFAINLNKYFITKNSELTFSVFSNVDAVSRDRNMGKEISGLFSYLFHWDYYDYYKKEGLKIGYSLENQEIFPYVKFSLSYEIAKHSNLEKKTDKSLFSKSLWRENPKILEGNLKTFELDFSISTNPEMFGFVLREHKTGYKFDIELVVGEISNGLIFGLISPKVFVEFPTFYTGYNPMMIKMLFELGISTNETPPQYEFKMPNAWGFGNFLTAPTCRFGGKRFFSLHIQHNFSDLLWRTVGLPTIKGRGFELSATFSLGVFSNYGMNKLYSSNKNLFYEFGFGFSRIPTLISDFIHWGIDFKINPNEKISKGFGFALNVNLPF